MRKNMYKMLSVFLILSFVAVTAYCADEAVLGKKRWIVENDGDLVPGADSTYNIGSSGTEVANVYADAIVATGDFTFRSTLTPLGREGGASTVSSSSTAIDPMNQAYTVVRKCIGGNGCLEETGVGTILEDGTPGKVVVLVLITLDTDGSWIVTPRTSSVMTNVVLDAVGEMITLLYLDDTVGWIPMSVEGATVTYNVNDYTS